jgi:hypothetical protein
MLFFNTLVRSRIRRSIQNLGGMGKVPYDQHVAVQFDEDMYDRRTETSETRNSYSTIERVCVGESAFYLYENALQAVIIPFRVFASDAEKEAFHQFIVAKAAAAAQEKEAAQPPA